MRDVKIRWLASYPKSGNTWIRLWIEAYMSCRDPILNAPTGSSTSDCETRWYQASCVHPLGDLDVSEQAMIRPAALLNATYEMPADVVMKTHQPRAMVSGTQLIPGHLSRSALYVVRDPRDVAVSWALHSGLSIDEAIRFMEDPSSATRAKNGVYQLVGSWSKHVLGWTATLPEDLAGPDFPVTLVRYEDLGDIATWRHIVESLGLEFDPSRASFAMDATAFERLQEREQSEGFVEAVGTTRFFRSGRAGAWKESLTDDQVVRLEGAHGPVMRTFGYAPTVQ